MSVINRIYFFPCPLPNTVFPTLYSSIRSFGEEFIDSESWVRYLGDNFVVKGSYANFGRQGLEFGQLDARWKKAIGSNWNFSLGGNFRGHPAYGLFPFNDWLANSEGQWWELGYQYGYDDENICLPPRRREHILATNKRPCHHAADKA